MRTYALLVLILGITACRPAERAVVSGLTDVLTPASNIDLFQLQLGLYHYRLKHSGWPEDSMQLNNFLKQEALAPIRSRKYKELNWLSTTKTIQVAYFLRYNASDSLHLKSLKGHFNLSLGSDSSLHAVHLTLTAEKVDNTIMELDGEWALHLQKPQ